MSLSRHLIAALSAALLGALSTSAALAAPVVHTADFIANGTRTGFNGFEAIPNNGTFFTGGNGPHAEGGILVQQVNGDGGNSIWVTYNPSGSEGAFSWYPNGGDSGYTMITRSGGIDFDDLGMLVGSGNSGHNNVYFELYDNSILVLTGNVAHGVAMHYLGWSGGGFDTVLLRDGPAGQTVRNASHNAMALDSIEMRDAQRVPEPGTLALLGIAGLAAGATRRRAQR